MERSYCFSSTPEKRIEKIIDDDVVMMNHILLNKGDFVPRHRSNSNVYLIVVNGSISLVLEGTREVEQQAGHVISIPYGLDMEISNRQDAQLEFFVVKAPSPRLYLQNGEG